MRARDRRPRRSASPTARGSTATASRRHGEMVEGGPIDVLTGDWLAELTMLILAQARARKRRRRLRPHLPDPDGAGARHLPRAAASRSSPTPAASTPAACADAVRELADRLGLAADDRPRRGRRPARRASTSCCAGVSSTNLDTGAPLATARPADRQRLPRRLRHRRRARRSGADVVVCRPRHRRRARGRPGGVVVAGGRATTGTAWPGAVAAGHVIECGAQATGGNYAFFDEVPRS